MPPALGLVQPYGAEVRYVVCAEGGSDCLSHHHVVVEVSVYEVEIASENGKANAHDGGAVDCATASAMQHVDEEVEILCAIGTGSVGWVSAIPADVGSSCWPCKGEYVSASKNVCENEESESACEIAESGNVFSRDGPLEMVTSRHDGSMEKVNDRRAYEGV